MTLLDRNGMTTVERNAAEERVSKKRAVELFDRGYLDRLDVGKFAALKLIHKYMFGDVCENAGEMRTVNIVKGKMRFTPVEGLSTALDFVDIMPMTTFNDIISKYVQMNVAHPFRSGNGRTTRIWLDAMLKKTFSVMVNWSAISKDAYKAALEKSALYDGELKELIGNALTRDIGRLTYLKGIDASFYFEGLSNYRAQDL